MTGRGVLGGFHLESARALGRALHDFADAVGCDVATAARLIPPSRSLWPSPGDLLSAEALWAGLSKGVDQALAQLQQMRRQEGKALAEDLRTQRSELASLLARIRKLSGDEAKTRFDHLKQRVSKLVGDLDVDEQRLVQEIALLADRAAIDEETTRLDSHLSQLDHLMGLEEPIGRRIEFLVQEVNRELNTIASKTTQSTVSQLVVEAKAAVERVREQAQNVE